MLVVRTKLLTEIKNMTNPLIYQCFLFYVKKLKTYSANLLLMPHKKTFEPDQEMFKRHFSRVLFT